MNDLWDVLDHLGDPIPCELCGTITPSGDLTECWVPAHLIQQWDVMVERAVYVCLRCPVV